MLYGLHEMSHAVFYPWTTSARVISKFLTHPSNPLSHIPGASSVAAAQGVFGDLTRRYPKPGFNLTSTVCDKDTVPVKERIIKRKPFAQLKHFQRSVERPEDPTVLIVAPLSGHFSTLLRETVREMLPDHDVYITDWRDARKVPMTEGRFGLDEYIDYIIDFIDELGPSTHVLAVCQPVVATLAAVSIMSEDQHPSAPQSLTLMAGPIDARIDPTQPCKLAVENKLSWFRNNLIYRVPPPHAGFGRRVYPGFLQLTGFINMNPDRHISSYLSLFRSIQKGESEKVERHRDFYDEYLAVMDMPEEYYLETIHKVFQDFQLARGCLYHRGRLVDPGAIRKTALMTVEGENDDISSPGQTYAAQTLCVNLPESLRNHHHQVGAGHYGVFSGSRWRKEIAPRVKAFMRSSQA